MWEFIPVKTGSLKFIIVRKTEGGEYRCVGSNVIDISGMYLNCCTENLRAHKKTSLIHNEHDKSF